MTTIGIDLGTTYSVVATVDAQGEAVILPNLQGRSLTPSVVHFSADGTTTIGDDAKAESSLDPERTVVGIKRQMGQETTLTFGSLSLTPEGVSGALLLGLATSAATALGVPLASLSVVITVPAYFGVAERESTAQAASIAGLTLLDLVAEPVASAISYGVDSGATGSVLVFDLGGGTFDTTVLQLAAAGPEVVVTDGDSQLGGFDWDIRLRSLLLERYLLATEDEDAQDDDEFMLGLALLAEEIKQELTERESVTRPVRRGAALARITVSRKDFEDATTDLVVGALSVVDRTLAAARAARRTDVTEVILVGGSTRMPMIRSALERHLGLPVLMRDPDLAVAKGAALHAAAIAREAASTPGSLAPAGYSAKGQRGLGLRPARTVVPRALGIALLDSHDPDGSRRFVQHIVAANTPLPVVRRRATFATIIDEQERVRVELFEQAGPVASAEFEHNRRVLDGELTGLPPLPAGSPILVQISVGTDGRISCTATEPGSGRHLLLESYMDGVADTAAIDDQRAAVARLTLAT